MSAAEDWQDRYERGLLRMGTSFCGSKRMLDAREPSPPRSVQGWLLRSGPCDGEKPTAWSH